MASSSAAAVPTTRRSRIDAGRARRAPLTTRFQSSGGAGRGRSSLRRRSKSLMAVSDASFQALETAVIQVLEGFRRDAQDVRALGEGKVASDLADDRLAVVVRQFREPGLDLLAQPAVRGRTGEEPRVATVVAAPRPDHV